MYIYICVYIYYFIAISTNLLAWIKKTDHAIFVDKFFKQTDIWGKEFIKNSED